VVLVGAGPGHPGLLTIRAVEAISWADYILFDRLVPLRLLDAASPRVERVCVEDLPGPHCDKGPLIQRLLIEQALSGKKVVRLHGGDPFVFGRGGEEAEALRRAGLAFEVVPGVSSGLAASACAGIPLTHRDHASAVAFITGHEAPGKVDGRLDWDALARFPGTLVVFMGLAKLEQIVTGLLERGKNGDTLAAAVQSGSLGLQRTITARLAELPARVKQAGLVSPTLLVIGDVVGLRERLAWFEKRPLFGKTVLVTRPRHQAGDFLRRLEDLGATTLLWPTVEVKPLDDWSLVDKALERLATFHWLVFTSVNGVQNFIKRLRDTGRDLRVLGHLKLATIGPATTEALRSYHLEPDLMPAEYRSEALVESLRQQVKGRRVLLARADRGRELLRDELSSVAEVEQIAVYHQGDSNDPPTAVRNALRSGSVDYVTLTSSNIARSLARQLDEATQRRFIDGSVKIVTISPVTSAAVRELGWPIAAEATEYTTAGVTTALTKLAESVDGQIGDDPAGGQTENVDDGVNPPEGDLHQQVEQKEQQH
jgi:uroporphyrinogen III methyltransferase/synthase